jgi:Rrf2 family protein
VSTNVQFSIAVHVMAGLGYFGRKDITSGDLASSVNTSPSFVRRILARLSRAGLIETSKGKSGACWLAMKPAKISLLDIYKAVEAPKAFAIHRYPARLSCPVSTNIKSSLSRALDKTQASLERSLKEISLAEVITGLKRR